MGRTGLLGPFQLAEIHAFDECINISPFLDVGLPPVPTRELLVATMLQCGFDHLDVASTGYRDFPVAGLLGQRCRETSIKNWVDAFIVVHGLFEEHIPGYWPEGAGVAGDVQRFLVDVLFSLAEQKPLVMASPPPAMADIECSSQESRLPLEILVPVRNLLRQLQPLVHPAVVPALKIDRGSIARYFQIVADSLFERYVADCHELDQEGLDRAELMMLVNASAERLCAKFKRMLILDKAASFLLPFGEGLLETGLGTLPGDVGKRALGYGAEWLKSRKRLCIYTLHTQMMEMLTLRCKWVCEDS